MMVPNLIPQPLPGSESTSPTPAVGSWPFEDAGSFTLFFAVLTLLLLCLSVARSWADTAGRPMPEPSTRTDRPRRYPLPRPGVALVWVRVVGASLREWLGNEVGLRSVRQEVRALPFGWRIAAYCAISATALLTAMVLHVLCIYIAHAIS